MRTAGLVALVAGVPAVLTFAGILPVWAALLLSPVVLSQFTGRYTLMFHAMGHRPIFKREHRWMENLVPWVIGPLYGHSPTSFYVHHMGMHHPENNTATDLSSTIAYQRDRLDHFLHYWFRFFAVGHIHMVHYLWTRGRHKLLRSFVGGELIWLTVVGVLLYLAPGPTLVVFVVPFVVLRWFMMCGNWGQHAFVDVDDPDNAYRNSICVVNVPYNHTCLNDGYHIVHHLRPALHWTAMPSFFLEQIEEFGAQDAVVFTGLGDNVVVWFCLMTQRWDHLARHLVDLPGQPERTHDEKVAWLQERVRRQTGRIPGMFELVPKPD